MRRLVLNAAAILCFGFLFAASAYSAEGRAVGVDPDALARFSGTDRILSVGADISLGEQIVTGPSGQVQIVFSDQTRLVVGPGSALVIDTYLFNGNTADKFAINALAGSFRFISGHSAKPAYSIKTPTASIAVRGTKFDFNVSRSRTDLMLYEGTVRLCSTSGTCQELISRCDLGTVDASVAQLINYRDPAHPELSSAFRYARFQTPLLSEFRVSGAGKCVELPGDNGTPGSLSPSGGGAASQQTQQPNTSQRFVN